MFVIPVTGCCTWESIPTVTTGSSCESLAIFSTILSAELEVQTELHIPIRESEPFDEASAWIETGGDSLPSSREPFDGSSERRIETGGDSLTATDSRTACDWDSPNS